MKKQLPPAAIAAIVGLAVVVLGVVGTMYFRNATGSGPEDPELLQKQLETQQQMTRGRNMAQPTDSNNADERGGQPPQMGGFSGGAAEGAARQANPTGTGQ